MALRSYRRPSAPATGASSSVLDSGTVLRKLLILAAVLFVYWPALRGSYVLDDAWYYTDNPLLKSLGGLGKIWFQPGSWVEYYPVHETIMWLQWQFFGSNPLGYHLTNVAVHVINAILLWRLLEQLGVRWAYAGGLLFALHPVAVDSVANMAELKSLISVMPLLFAMIAWVDFESSGRQEKYLAALGWFLLAMLCKIAVAAFPAVILLFAWWKRGRLIGRDLLRSVPFFVIAVALGAATIWAGHTYNAANHLHALDVPLGSFLVRFVRAGWIFSYYFAISFVPVGLAPIFPLWATNPANIFSWFPWLIFIGIIGWAWSAQRAWGRHVLLGLGFFALNVAPFLGFFPISYMHDSWVELHLLYMPVIGLIGLIAAALGDLDVRLGAARHRALVGAAAVIICLFALQARSYAGWFVDEETLWTRTLERYPQSWLATYNLGAAMEDEHRFASALPLLQQAEKMMPDYAEGHDSLGYALNQLGETSQAVTEFHQAQQLDPDDRKALLNLGEIARTNGDLAGAESLFQQGLKIAPDDASLNVDEGGLLLQQGRAKEAVDLYQRAVEASPDIAQLQYNLGLAYMKMNDLANAAPHLARAVSLDPSFVAARENYGVVLAQMQHLPEAMDQFNAALALDPTNPRVRDNLALALVRSGQIKEGMDQFQKETEVNPSDDMARAAFQKLQAMQAQPPAGH